MSELEVAELIIKVNKALLEVLDTLKNHKEALEILYQRMDAIDNVLYSHKESIEYLDSIVNEPYILKNKGKKVFIQ